MLSIIFIPFNGMFVSSNLLKFWNINEVYIVLTKKVPPFTKQNFLNNTLKF